MFRPSFLFSLFLSVACFGAVPGMAETRRVGFMISNHHGGGALPELRYAQRDAERLTDVLVHSSMFERNDIVFLVDADADDLRFSLDRLNETIKTYQAAGEQILLLLYYSGHSANGVMRMGDTQFPMAELKERINESAADIKLVFVDSCGAGAMTREKGGQLAPPFLISIDDTLEASGQVIITSSSATEASQESDEIQGSFFTHYLTSGLRGAADENQDRRVTLDEVYTYAYAKTVASTANTRSGVQHPTYSFDLSGSGDIVLARFGPEDIVMTFPKELSGSYFIVDERRELFVAEVEKEEGALSQIALPPGRYVIKKRLDTHLLMKRLGHREKGQIVIDEADMEIVSFEDDYAKGTPILTEEIDGGLGYSFSLGMGAQYVFDDPSAGALFPPLAFVSFEGRLTNVFSEHLVLAMDLGFGTRQHTIDLQDELGASYLVQYSQLQMGSTGMFAFTMGPLLLAAGPRVALLYVRADYLDLNAPVSNQYFLTATPGMVALVGASFWGFFHVEAQARANYLLYNLENRNLGYVEGLVSAWVDF
jgi:hypothetical protein